MEKRALLKVEPQLYWDSLPEAVKAVPYDYDRGTDYVNGCYKTATFNDTTKLPPVYKNIVNYFKQEHDIYDAQIFSTLSTTDGVGWHHDPDNVLIYCLYGEATYQLRTTEHQITMKEGELLYIPKLKQHIGLGSDFPRIILSMATKKRVPHNQVDYHYTRITGDRHIDVNDLVLNEVVGRGFKKYCWNDQEGFMASGYFATEERAEKWRQEEATAQEKEEQENAIN